MSNVLIGIIGVILFIGLALAGALFLGPRFQQATNNSKASAMVQAVSQVASAANMQNVQAGSTVSAATDSPTTLATAGYLKAVPSNPTGGSGSVAMLIDATGKSGAGAGDAKYSVMAVGGAIAADVCAAVAKQSGDTGITTVNGADQSRITADMTGFTGPSGCVRTSAAVNSLNIGAWVYAAI